MIFGKQIAKIKKRFNERENKSLVVQNNKIKDLEPTPLMILANAIQNKEISIDVIKELTKLKNEEEDRQAKRAYFKALSNFQAECPEIEKTTIVYNKDGSERYRYAKIGQIINQVKGLLGKHGLSFSMKYEPKDNGVNITCEVHHIDGHMEPTSVFMPIKAADFMKMSDQQKIGMAQTYGDRYCISGALGIVTIDQDLDGKKMDEKESTIEDIEIYRMAIVGLLTHEIFTDDERKRFKSGVKNGKIKTLNQYRTQYNTAKLIKLKRIKESNNEVNEESKKPDEKQVSSNSESGQKKLIKFFTENQRKLMANKIYLSDLKNQTENMSDEEIDIVIAKQREKING